LPLEFLGVECYLYYYFFAKVKQKPFLKKGLISQKGRWRHEINFSELVVLFIHQRKRYDKGAGMLVAYSSSKEVLKTKIRERR